MVHYPNLFLANIYKTWRPHSKFQLLEGYYSACMVPCLPSSGYLMHWWLAGTATFITIEGRSMEHWKPCQYQSPGIFWCPGSLQNGSKGTLFTLVEPLERLICLISLKVTPITWEFTLVRYLQSISFNRDPSHLLFVDRRLLWSDTLAYASWS